MFSVSKLIPYPVLKKLPNFQQVSYARMAYQFRTEPKPTFLYPDRRQEMKILEDQVRKVVDVNENKEAPMDHHYKLLGVTKDATTTQIKAAYYTLAKNFYNETTSGTERETKRFSDIVKAYHCLVNNVKQREYKLDPNKIIVEQKRNEVTTSSSTSQVKPAPSLLDPPTKFINRRKSPNSGKDTLQTVAIKEDYLNMANTATSLELTFLEAAHGQKKSVDMKYLKKCPSCSGKSHRAARLLGPEQCRKCKGTGQMPKKSAPFSSMTVCDQCNGKRYTHRNQCEMCDNRGFVLDAAKVTIPIPLGAKTGDRVSVKNPHTGQCTNYCIQVKHSNYFTRDGNNVLTDKYITISDAVLGGIFKVRGVYEDVNLKIKPGTESHTKFVMKGKGIRSLQGPGDHIITVKIKVPRQLTKKQRQLMLTFAKTEESDYQHMD
uniref:J domain-containing protein n=1 Tax=Glossina brevipalpis TaxID=37001 RepID=A0A1A9WLM4_9MUSC